MFIVLHLPKVNSSNYKIIENKKQLEHVLLERKRKEEEKQQFEKEQERKELNEERKAKEVQAAVQKSERGKQAQEAEHIERDQGDVARKVTEFSQEVKKYIYCFLLLCHWGYLEISEHMCRNPLLGRGIH